MEDVLSKYNFTQATVDDEKALRKDLNSQQVNDAVKHIDLNGIRNIANVIIKKICVPNFPIWHSPGGWMASATMGRLSVMVSQFMDQNKQIQDHDACQGYLFDILVALFSVGPSSGLYDAMETLINAVNMKQYIKGIKGEKLRQLSNAIKQHKYQAESGWSIDEFASFARVKMPLFIETFVCDKEEMKTVKIPELWSTYFDLTFFFFRQSLEVPQQLHGILHNCALVFYDIYDRKNIFKGFHDINQIKEHNNVMTQLLSGSVSDIQIEWCGFVVECLCNMNGDQMEAAWEDLMALFKSVSSKNEYSKIVEHFSGIANSFTGRQFEKNGSLFSVWSAVVVECMTNRKEQTVVGHAVCGMVSDVLEKYKPQDEDMKQWFKILQLIISIPTSEMQKCAKNILLGKKFKKLWAWKDNVSEARSLVSIVDTLDLPLTEEDTADAKDCNINCGKCMEALIKKLQIFKADHLVMEDICRMTLGKMEKKSKLINLMVDQYIKEINLQKVQDIVPEMIQRFENLVRDKNYPWINPQGTKIGHHLFEQFISAYKSGKDIPDEVNHSVTRIVEYCMEDTQELINPENGGQTIYQALRMESTTFVFKHCESCTEGCVPVLRMLLTKYRNSDDEHMQEIVRNTIQWAGANSPNVCAHIFGPILDWYIDAPSLELISILYLVADKVEDTSEIKERWSKFTEVALKDKMTYGCQIMIYLRMASSNPELFTEKVVELMMKGPYNDASIRVQIFNVLMKVTETHAEVFIKYMDKVLKECRNLPPMEQYGLNGVLVNVAQKFENYKIPVKDFLLDVVKKSHDQTQMTVTLSALRDLCLCYGPELLQPHRDYIIQRKDVESDSTIRQSFVALVDAMEGRSLKGVAKDVKETQESVKNVDKKVMDNEATIKSLATTVKQKDGSIEELEGGLKSVNRRIAHDEKDIQETKSKVEELNDKMLTSVPRWADDLAKLLNPGGWKVLAQRLGYSNDDIQDWETQHDPCMAVLSQWYTTHKIRPANLAVLMALQNMDRVDGVALLENAMKADADVVEDEEVEYASPPPVFLSYQWGHQNEVKLIRNHLQMAGYECWMDIGQMGGGDKLFEKIDNGIRGAKVIICCVSEKYAASPNCNREVNLSVNLGKPMIPLLMEKMSWPPKGSMGPIFSEYLFVRFFQRAGEETEDERIWPVAKFQEVLMQLSCYNVRPDEDLIHDMYKNWWITVQKSSGMVKDQRSQPRTNRHYLENKSPEIFISYQWGKQKQIMALYQRLTGMGLNCWLDIHQMGGGDSLYEKIDSGVRGCKVILTCITQKYALSANCQREVSLADALKKPMIPLLLEKMDWPTSGPMSMVITQLNCIECSGQEVQMSWSGPKFNELLLKLKEHIPLPDLPRNDADQKLNKEKEPRVNTNDRRIESRSSKSQKTSNDKDQTQSAKSCSIL